MDDPIEWLAAQIKAGINLREECYALRTPSELDDWEVRREKWERELIEGVRARNTRDAHRVEVVDELSFNPLPLDHPWCAHGMGTTATGEGRPGNTPYNFHCAQVERAKEVDHDWRAQFPNRPKLRATTPVARDQFASWYHERARKMAQSGERSSREEDHHAAEAQFKCEISPKWIRGEREKLPLDHPFRKRGRRPINSGNPN